MVGLAIIDRAHRAERRANVHIDVRVDRWLERKSAARSRYLALERSWARRLHWSNYQGAYLRHVPAIMRLYAGGHGTFQIARKLAEVDARRDVGWARLFPGVASPFKALAACDVRYVLIANGVWMPSARHMRRRVEILAAITKGVGKDELVEHFGNFVYRVIGQENLARIATYRRAVRRERLAGMGRVIDMGGPRETELPFFDDYSGDRGIDAVIDPLIFDDVAKGVCDIG